MVTSVLWVIKGLGPGGAERLLVESARPLHEQGVALTCAYVVPWKHHLVPELQSSGVQCRCVGRGTGRGGAWWPVRLVRLVRRGGFHVVHVHSPLPGSIARLAARSLPRARRPIVVTTEHNAWGTYRLPTRVLNRLTCRHDQHTFAVSPEAAASVTGRQAARTTVLTHGVDVEGIRARGAHRAEARASLGLDDDRFVFVTVANYRTQKDYPNLLRACADLRDRGVPFTMLVVGQGPLRVEIEALHAELSLQDHVHLLGYRADVAEVMSAADAFVLGSAWEGLPVALMEATALGLPCVLTDVGGMRDALGDDGAVWVTPKDSGALADGMGQLLGDAALWATLAQRSAAAASQFDNHAVAVELARWYKAGVPAPRSVPAVPAGIEVRRAGDADLPEIIELCRRSLGWRDGDWEAMFRWKHFQNPFGVSPMWVAIADGRIVGLRTFMRWEFERDGRVVKAVRAVDTATDPDYQGKGLFTLLTLTALPELRAEGVHMVFNTPNTKSRPGYLKMGWQDVGTLRPVLRPVRLRRLPRVLRSRVPADHWPQEVAIGRSVQEWLAADGAEVLPVRRSDSGVRTVIDSAFASWRFGSALQPCRVLGSGKTFVVVEVRRRGVIVELVRMASFGPPRKVDRLLVRAAKDVGADVVIRLGWSAPWRGFVPVPGAGPRLTCLMLADEPMPELKDWHLFMGDVALF